MKQQNCLIDINIDNNNKSFFSSKSAYFRMISEGSCGTEDWSNNAENSAILIFVLFEGFLDFLFVYNC